MEASLPQAPGSKVAVAAEGTLLWPKAPSSRVGPLSSKGPHLPCAQNTGLHSSLTLALTWSGCSCVCWSSRAVPSSNAPTGLEYPGVPRRGEPSTACSCRPSHDISLCYSAGFFLSPHWPFKTCRTLQMGGAGCGTLSLCQEASLQSGHPSSPLTSFWSSLPWWNGAKLFLWSVKQLLDPSEELSHLKTVSDSGVLFVKNFFVKPFGMKSFLCGYWLDEERLKPLTKQGINP